MNSNVKQVSDVVGSMLQRVKAGELSTEYGLSFLEVKYHMLLNYLINLTYVVLRKCSGMSVRSNDKYFMQHYHNAELSKPFFIATYFLGQRIEKDPSIDRLIEIRTVLEKIRPIDHKLRYQIDKLVKTAITGTTNANDPLKLKANPANFDEDDSDSDASDESGGDDGLKREKRKSSTAAGSSDKYVPPKITSMPYEDEESNAQKQREKARKRAINSALIDEWKEEFLDTPVEIMGSSRAQQQLSREMKERERYEEDNLVRLPMTKEERHRQKRLSTMGALGDEITSFRGSLASSGNNKKRKKGGKGKKGAKRRKFH